MRFISHRGNITGRIEKSENDPYYIDDALAEGYDVEVDIRLKDRHVYLGHDYPQYPISIDWLQQRSDKLWIHCKDLPVMALIRMILDYDHSALNYFWHEEDKVALTSHKYMWIYPGVPLEINSIAVLPETVFYERDDIKNCYGICSDVIGFYKYAYFEDGVS